jgi:RHS repeat-associated protein
MQRLQTYCNKWLLLLIGLLFIIPASRAGNGGGQIKAIAVLDGSRNQIKIDSSRTVEDSAFFNPANIGSLDTGYAVQNQVTLMINEASALYLRTAFSVTVRMRITFANSAGIVDSTDRNFTVGYDSAGTYNSRSTFAFGGARKVTVRILSDSSNVTSWDPNTVLLIENQLTTHPLFTFNCSNTISSITVNPSDSVDADELPVSWTTVHGADQYDLEWTYIAASALRDVDALGNYKYGNPVNPALLFLNNATRVTVAGNAYNIPLIYDDSGTLFIRVRPIQVKNAGAVTAASWSSEGSVPVMGQYIFAGHQRAMNWQSNISYAEEGKRKVVVQYYDGTLRNRQTVTKDNSTNTDIIAETYYDYQGRPTIQVMPSPTLSNIIKYTASFNVSINGAEYSQSNYDTLPDLVSVCGIRADSMSSLSGAGLYYSPHNPLATQGINQFIPDAQGYPFSETEYMADNTGRLSRQGSVGPYHQLNSGHEKKYFYGTPGQHELDALFGTEVGDHSHYYKNMVRSENGQYAVTYVDMHGRTIASALAGNAPPSLAQLASNVDSMTTEPLLDPGTVFFQDQSMISQKALVVSTADSFQFNYNFSPPTYTGQDCQLQNVCYTCRYDLEITISGDCNDQLPGGKPFDTVLHNFSLGNIGYSCPATIIPLSLQFSKYLPEGSYVVTKKLTVNKDAYDFYRDSVYLPANTCSSLQQFITEQKTIIASTTTDCVPDCKACRDNLGTYSQFQQNYIAKAGLSYPVDTAAYGSEVMTAYNNALSSCAALCGDSLSDDQDIVQAMLQDMSPPYGQYADSILAHSSDIYSIFYVKKDDSLDYVPVFKLPEVHYLDDNGHIDSVYDPTSGLMVLPNQLSMTQFVQNFRPSWANALLPYHPEYCKLQALQAQQPSNIWDRQMEDVDDFLTAYAKGYLNPTGNMTTLPFSNFHPNADNIDPLSKESTALKNALEAKLKTKVPAQAGNPAMNMWALACVMVKCDSNDTKCLASFADTLTRNFNADIMCDGDLDEAWRNFRQMYLSAKQDVLYDQIINKVSCTPANSAAYNKEPDEKTLYSAKHHPEFTDATFAISNVDDLSKAAGVSSPSQAASVVASEMTNLNSYYDQNCNALMSEWTQQLSGCTLYSPVALTDTILPRLRALCRAACDNTHPYGASTLPAGRTILIDGQSYSSFQQIIDTYNQSRGYANGLYCNAEVITVPQPYDKQPVYSALPVYTRPSDCQCSLIKDLYNMYLLAGRGDGSFSIYLKRTQQIDMTNEDLTQLRLLCGQPISSPAGCKNLATPIYLPPAMQCNSGPTCASCTLVSTTYTGYLQQYPADTPRFADGTDTLQAQKNQLFQNYMNNRLGFNKQAWEYLQFMDTCAAHAGEISNTTQCLDRNVANLYVSGGMDHMTDIQGTTDNGYIMAGSTTAGGTGGTDGYLIKTDHGGTIQWAKTFGGTKDDKFTRVRPVPGNSYIAIGTTRSAAYPQGEMMIVKTDGTGTMLWSKTIGFNTPYGEAGYDIIRTNDGGYAALGNYDQHNGNGDLLLARLDSLGNTIWIHRFGTSMRDNASCTIDISDTSTFSGNPSYGLLENNDTLVVTGTAYDRNLGSGYFGSVYRVVKTTGNIIGSWQYKDSVQNSLSNWFGDIYPAGTGYMLSVTNSWQYSADSSQAAVMRLSPNGTVLSYKRFSRPEGSDRITNTSVFPTSDGGYLVAQTADNAPHIYWQRMTATDSLLWTNETALPGSQSIGRLIQNNDSSFAAIINEDGHAMLVNLLAIPSQDCYDYPISLGLASPALVKVNMAAQGDQFLMATGPNASFTTATVSPTDSSIVCTGGGSCYNIYTGPTLCGKSQPLTTPASITTVTNCSDSTFFAVSKATELFKAYSDSLTGAFEQQYNNICLQGYKNEAFTVTHRDREYHYTLYYYDQAGTLIKTVPPAGVVKNTDPVWLDQVDSARAHGQILLPVHSRTTNYRYNTLNHLITRQSPDGGESHFWYDRLGRIVLSQNSRQLPNSQYTYSQYDSIGRMTQTGQLVSIAAMTDSISRNETALLQWENNVMATADQITVTTYDTANELIEPELKQRNLRNQVSWKGLFNKAVDMSNGSPNVAAATYYSYDIMGNIDTLVQDYGNGNRYPDVANAMDTTGNRFKKIVYDFDLVSGKVNMLTYQQGYADAFYHSYVYDAENRMTNVQSSIDSVNWDNDAFYSYYAHGPLARMILGQQQVQGINYAYSLQGWLKAVNPAPYTSGTFTLRPDSAGNIVANSAYSLLLNYFDGDYKPISHANSPDDGISVSLGGLNGAYRPLFDGNISSMGVNINKLNAPILYNYQYDQLNRLIHMDAWKRTAASWNALSPTTNYQENITYDSDGNILDYKRNGDSSSSGNQMDQLHYVYIDTNSNKLDHVVDGVSGSHGNDMTTQPLGNYKYDAIGELISDSAAGVTNVDWTIYGKIARITKKGDTTIQYTYDAAGNRISKTLIHDGHNETTWYVRDAQGNVLSVYVSGDVMVNGGDLAQTELNLYGIERLGIWRRSVDVQGMLPANTSTYPLSGDSIIFKRGDKLFELTNHLDNVLATVSDKRFGVSSNDSTVDYFNPELISANDYYPFGSLQPGRTYIKPNSGDYRYGFNGQERSDEVKGPGNSYTAEFWEYDPRIGRRWNVDPAGKEWESPYAAFSNNPISRVDPDGDSDTTHVQMGFKAQIYKDVMDESKARLDELGPAIEDLKNKISQLKSLFNTRVAYDIGMSWNPYSWGPQVVTDQIYGSDVDYMASVLADRLGLLQNAVDQYNKAYETYSYAVGALKGELMNASKLDRGLSTLDNAGEGGSKAAGIAGALHLNNSEAEGSFVLYQITVDNKLFKFGVADADRIRKGGDYAGLPERLAQQLSKIERYAPQLKVAFKMGKVKIVTKAVMLEKETKAVLAHAKLYGIPLGNLSHIAKYAEEFGKGELSAKALKALSKFMKIAK